MLTMTKIKRLLKALLKTIAVTLFMALAGAIGAECATNTVFLEWTLAVGFTLGFAGMVVLFYKLS